MSQLAFWDNLSHPSTPTQEKQNREQAKGPVPAKENRAALRCRSSSDAMQKHIDAKHQSANNMLAQPPTRKRLRDADGLRKQAIRLERIQATLRRLAEMHENGSIVPALASLTAKGALESALFTSPADSAIYLLYKPGYFPTPEPLAERLVEMASIEPGNRVLEPSAGTGNLIDAILKNHQNVQISYCELNCFLLDILRGKYEGMNGVSFLGRDYFDIDTNRLESRFDQIIMNPPFERGQDVDHVFRAWYLLLAPGGISQRLCQQECSHERTKRRSHFGSFFRTPKLWYKTLQRDHSKVAEPVLKPRLCWSEHAANPEVVRCRALSAASRRLTKPSSGLMITRRATNTRKRSHV